jgi:uncharacterized 2Fe-2S/4Fe-4S cluster protein (DUF4445 family)
MAQTAFEVIFEPVGKRGEFQAGLTVLESARQTGIQLSSLCGGEGRCGACRVRISTGTCSEPTPAEKESFSIDELREGWRLACQSVPLSNCTVFIPPETLSAAQRLQTEGLVREIGLEPAVRSYALDLPAPSMTDARSAASRLTAGLEKEYDLSCRTLDYQVLKTLSEDLHRWNWKTVVSLYKGEIVALKPPGSRQLGMAVDIGTTKIAAYLLDLQSGRTLSTGGVLNPQISFGEDIISRLNGAGRSPYVAQKLQNWLVSSIQTLAEQLCRQSDIRPQDILEAVMVGNTAIHHLLLGLPVENLGHAPYIAAVQEALAVKSRDLGFSFSPGSYVYVLPNIAGFVGADFTATLLAADVLESRGLTLILDIGTNTEAALVDGQSISCVSCASGPAFEGWHISQGMRAAAGAIERLYITDGAVKYQTVDNAPPIGICGSGIIDALSQMYLNGIIDDRGTMQKRHPLVQAKNDQYMMEIVPARTDKPGISVSQQDIREIQSAKAAIRTGIQILLEQTGHVADDLEKVLIAGAFGSYIDVESAMEIGMLPVLKRGKFTQIGNAAGAGARYALLSSRKRQEADLIARRAVYIELAAVQDFMKIFGACHYLGKYIIRSGKRVRL